MQVLWLRYLTEIDEKTRQISQDLLDNPDIVKAVGELEESSFSDGELYAYDHFWDMVRTSRMFIDGALKDGERRGMEKGMQLGIEKGIAEGIAQGIAQGVAQGVAEGEQKERIKNARAMKESGIQTELISRITGLTSDEIASL